MGDNWSFEDTVYKVGGQNVVFHQCDLANNTHDAFHANDDHDINPTSITPSLVHGCTTQDVRIDDADFGPQSQVGRGFYHCHDHHSSQNCDKAHAHINTNGPNIPENYNVTLHTVCHEIGHSVGLGHSIEDGSCLQISAVEERHLTAHDKNELSDNY